MMSKRYENLMKRIHAGENILLDGATGSELENRGIKMDNSWCGTASLAVSYTHLTLPTKSTV